MGAEPPPALQSPELLGPRPLGQQSAARPSASPTMASSGSSSTSSGTFALGPWGRITSQGICGWPGQGFSANVSTSPPARERWGPIGRARGSQASGVPKAGVGGRGGVGIVRSSCSFGTHMASPFSFPGRRCCVRGRAAGGRGPGAGGSGCCAGMRPFILTSSCGNGSPGALWLCRLQWLPLHRGLVPSAFRSLPPSDGKHGLCSCQPREARLPPTGIVTEGNLGAAPLRRLPGIPPRRVETRGGWDFLPPLFWGRVWFPFCLLVFLACRRGVGGGGGCPHHPCLSAWLSGCRQVTSKCTPVPGLPALLRHRGSTLGLRRPVLPRVL